MRYIDQEAQFWWNTSPYVEEIQSTISLRNGITHHIIMLETNKSIFGSNPSIIIHLNDILDKIIFGYLCQSISDLFRLRCPDKERKFSFFGGPRNKILTLVVAFKNHTLCFFLYNRGLFD